MQLKTVISRNAKNGGVSKTKVGAVLVVVGPILVLVGQMLTGEVDVYSGVQSLLPLFGGLLVVLGLRDAL